MRAQVFYRKTLCQDETTRLNIQRLVSFLVGNGFQCDRHAFGVLMVGDVTVLEEGFDV